MIKCDECKKRAEYNIQSSLVIYTIDKDENYSKEPEIDPDGETNDFLCEEHYNEKDYD